MSLSSRISVSGQIQLDDVTAISDLGFDVLINNRPDFEVVGQPVNSDIEEAALRCGLQYYYYPVTAFNFPGHDFQGMKSLFSDSSLRILAFCRSGTRSANLWLASLNDSAIKSSVDKVTNLGLDTSMFLKMSFRGG